MKILSAEAEDLPPIFALQKLAFESEARLVGSYEIPPMTQTLSDLEEEFAALVMLKAVMDDGKIVGRREPKLKSNWACRPADGQARLSGAGGWHGAAGHH